MSSFIKLIDHKLSSINAHVNTATKQNDPFRIHPEDIDTPRLTSPSPGWREDAQS